MPPVFCFLIPNTLGAEAVQVLPRFIVGSGLTLHLTLRNCMLWMYSCSVQFFSLPRSQISGMNNLVSHLASLCRQFGQITRYFQNAVTLSELTLTDWVSSWKHILDNSLVYLKCYQMCLIFHENLDLINFFSLSSGDGLAMRGMINNVQVWHRKEFLCSCSLLAVKRWWGHVENTGFLPNQISHPWLRPDLIIEEKIRVNVYLWKPVRKFSTEIN